MRKKKFSLQNIRKEVLESNQIINFEKLRSKVEFIKELEKKKKEQLAYYLKIQIENLEGTENHIKANLDNLEKIQKSIIGIKKITKQNKPPDKIDIEKVRRLIKVEKNLAVIMEGLGNFINISNKLEEMEVLLKDENNFVLIKEKLDKLNGIKKSFKSTAKADSTFKEKFQDVEKFERKFYKTVLGIFERFVELCTTDKELLIEMVDIIMNTSNPEENYSMLKFSLKDTIEERFEDRISNQKDIGLILENIKFSVDDLLILHEHFVPLFKKEFKVFEFLEDCYKTEIKKNILPFVKDLSFLKENPGTLVYLINWLNSYEKLLTKVGFNMNDYQDLREKIKENMPIFFEHISKLFKNFIDKISNNDNFLFKPDFEYDIVETETPEDVATFLNQQIDFLGTHLQGEMLLKLFKVWLTELQKYIDDYVD